MAMPADNMLSRDGDRRIVFNLPFYSVRFLDSRKTLTQDLQAIQEKLQAVFAGRGLAGDWHSPTTALRDSRLKRDVDNRHGITFTPSYSIERTLDHATLESLPDDVGWTLDSDDAEALVRRRVEEVRVRQFESGLDSALRLLWTHRGYLIEVLHIEEQKRCEKYALRIVFRRTPGALVDASIRNDMVVFAGSGNSLLFAEKSVPMDGRMLPVCTIQMQNICWARAENFDGGLFFYLNSLSFSAESDHAIKRTVDKFEGRSNDIVGLLENATLFRFTIEDYVYHFDPQLFVIWSALSDCWAISRRFDAIDHKLQTVSRVCDRTRNSFKSFYDSQFNALVFWFTAFTVLAVLFDLIRFLGGRGPLLPIDMMRATMLAAGDTVIFASMRFLLRKWL